MTTNELTHDDIKTLATTYANIIQPDHPYNKYSPYPITEDRIDYGYKQASSSYYASCGPRSSTTYTLGFSADKKYFNNCTPARLMAILTHELTHVTVGSHSDQEAGAHPPRFWREFGFNAHIVLENWDEATRHFDEPVSKRDYIGEIIANEVTSFNIDRRYADEMTRKHEMAKWFKNTLKNADDETPATNTVQAQVALDD